MNQSITRVNHSRQKDQVIETITGATHISSEATPSKSDSEVHNGNPSNDLFEREVGVSLLDSSKFEESQGRVDHSRLEEQPKKTIITIVPTSPEVILSNASKEESDLPVESDIKEKETANDTEIPIEKPQNETTEKLKLSALIIIKKTNEFLKNNRQKKLCIEFNENDSFDQLLSKIGNFNKKILKEKPRLYKKLEKAPIDIHRETEADTNAELCILTLLNNYTVYAQKENIRAAFSNFAIPTNSTDISSTKIDQIINNTLISLKKLREHYFSFIRTITDPNIGLHKKLEVILKKIDDELYESYLTTMKEAVIESSSTLHKVIEARVAKKIMYLNEIQCLIDCLEGINSSKKTIEKLKIVRETSITCHNVYKDRLNKKTGLDHIAAQELNSDLTFEFYEAKKVIFNFAKDLTLAMNSVTENSKQVVTRIVPKEQVNIKSKVEVKKETNNAKTNHTRGNRIETPPPSTEDNLIPKKVVSEAPKLKEEVPVKPKSAVVVEVKKRDNEVVLATPELNIGDRAIRIILPKQEEQESFSSDEDSFEDIQEEINPMMELIRQLYEQDREKKLEEKKAKLRKHELSVKPKEDFRVEIKIKPKVIVLHRDEQLTLDAVLLENPPHLTISSRSARNLIVELKGQEPQKNKKGKYPIYWKDPTTQKRASSKSGVYEVTHGGDSPEVLTSGWAKRLGDAIKNGVKAGYIAEETVYGIKEIETLTAV